MFWQHKRISLAWSGLAYGEFSIRTTGGLKNIITITIVHRIVSFVPSHTLS